MVTRLTARLPNGKDAQLEIVSLLRNDQFGVFVFEKQPSHYQTSRGENSNKFINGYRILK
jgi:hypothetical protein